MGRATTGVATQYINSKDFNPRPPWGGRHQPATCGSRKARFQSTPSVGRATLRPLQRSPAPPAFQSTPSVGRATLRGFFTRTRLKKFQSTPSVGRATARGVVKVERVLYFNPRPPWGGRPGNSSSYSGHSDISIHALRGEGDSVNSVLVHRIAYFNPRPPWGGRPLGKLGNRIKGFFISIHALRGEGDPPARLLRPLHRNFNPRPPWGGRRGVFIVQYNKRIFQSTPSVGRATIF